MYLLDNYYTLSEISRMVHSTICTRLFYPNALLIRRPFFLRGKPRFSYGKGFTTGYGCRIEAFGDDRKDKAIRIEIAENCHLGDNVHIVAANHVTIGKNFLAASKVFISDCGHGEYSGPDSSHPGTDPSKRTLTSLPVVIGDNVWLGENVCVLKGVHIGAGAIIGANAVVIRDIPANSIAVGSPAKVIKQYCEESKTWKKA